MSVSTPLVVHGVTLVAVDQHLHGAVERGGEQERLALAVGVPEDPLDLGQEPHVGHAVGLVEHDVVDRATSALRSRRSIIRQG